MAPHICIVANTTWYAFNFRGRLIAELIARGYRATVLAPMDEYAERITALGARHVPLPLNNAGTNPFSELMTVVRIGNLLRRITPTVMLTYTPKVNIYASLAARLLGIPVIANISGLGRAFTAGGWLEAVVRRLYGFALRTPRIVFFQNEDDLEEFVRSGLVSREKAARIPGSGVDLERFAAATNTRHDGECKFLFTSRLLWDKGLAEYVKAARLVKAAAPHTRFLLLGFLDVANPSAVPRDQVERWHRDGIVDYLGSTDDVVSQLAAVDCVVLPSFYREGVPRSLLEAASMGLPVITTDTPGCRDVVEDGVTGYLCRPRDAGDLAAKMMRMAALSAEERTVMGAAGREKMVREFDERIVIARYLEVIDGITGPRPVVPTD
jgi:glycosyltransferase involved in cell wall biosynthesis